MLTQISASSPAAPINLLNNKKVPTTRTLGGVKKLPRNLNTPRDERDQDGGIVQ
jgi:hypothetical protein